MADKKSNEGFAKNPLTDAERERLAKKIIMGAAYGGGNETDDEVSDEDLEKTKVKPILIRVPVAQYKKLLKIKKMTGLTMNGVCCDLIWTAIKLKLTELGED
ncbi:MAG TPA: hypothetical protein VIQ77_15295 [Mucilaginibacter sp.]|jgi:hypothetical protein